MRKVLAWIGCLCLILAARAWAEPPKPEPQPKKPKTPPGGEVEAIGGLALGMERKKVEELLGPAPDLESSVVTWHRELWRLPNPDEALGPEIAVDGQLQVTFDQGVVRAVALVMNLTEEQCYALFVFEGDLADVEVRETPPKDATPVPGNGPAPAAGTPPAAPIACKPWKTKQGLGLAMNYDQVIDACGEPTLSPGLKVRGPDGSAGQAAKVDYFDNRALDLRYRRSEVEWIAVILRDLDLRRGHMDFRVVMIRLDRPQRRPSRGG